MEGRALRLAAILVHYHTAELARRACAALVSGVEADRLDLEIVVVDNGSTEEERGILAALPARLVHPGSNRGYAGGVNLGFRETDADLVVVLNPDVFVLPGCLRQLVEALEAGVAAAGPRFYWDSDRSFLLPPTERVGRLDELLRVLANRGHRWSRRARRRWRRHAWRFWRACRPLPSYDLSGALLALRRDAWQEVGPFDEGYRLYFEETDWLQRLRAAGLPAWHLPAAEAVHLHARSTAREPRAEAWFLESSRRFRRRRYGHVFNAWLERLGRPRPEPEPPLESPAGHDPQWLEVSLSPLGFPAAARRPAPGQEPVLPAELRERLATSTVYLRTVGADGRELVLRAL